MPLTEASPANHSSFPTPLRAQVEACEAAYKKMDNVLVDDRRIKVDFSQSVAKIWCVSKGLGVLYDDVDLPTPATPITSSWPQGHHA